MTSDFSTPLGRFRIIAILEGISYLLLLGIAMLLKYFAGIPEAVKIVGWVHGLLFVLFLLALIQVSVLYSWKFGRVVWAFIASLLPFGPFVLERQLKQKP